jgi:hypothetical protein
MIRVKIKRPKGPGWSITGDAIFTGKLAQILSYACRIHNITPEQFVEQGWREIFALRQKKKTVDQLEREYRKRRRAEGIKLNTMPIDMSPAAEEYCKLAQISRSEYVLALLLRDRPNRVQAIKRGKVTT